MARIPQTFIDDLLNRLDIVEIIDARVKLKKTGKNYSACCPFHDEKTPSFTVSPDKQFYYCFGCGATGNAVSFIMEHSRQGFIDAVETLAKHAGLEVPKEESSPQIEAASLRNKQLYELLKQASEYYQQQLKTHRSKEQAVRYLKRRGLTGGIAKTYSVGYAPPGWDNLLLRLGQNEENIEHLVLSGLAIKREDNNRIYDRFRNRIMFPIRDVRGRIIGFGGRVLGDDKPKYLNSPETKVFSKGRELYGLYEAKQHSKLDKLLVVEGYMDVIALAQYGIRNAVATLGTACSEEHLHLAFRYTSKIVFCFDGDQAGRNAAKRALLNSLTSMEDGREISFLFLPEGQDPDTLIRQIGHERFSAQLDTALPLEDFLFEVAAEDCRLENMEGRARFAKTAAPLLNKLPKSIYKELMLANLAKRTGLSANTLKELNQEAINLNLRPEPADQHEPPHLQRNENNANQAYSEYTEARDYTETRDYAETRDYTDADNYTETSNYAETITDAPTYTFKKTSQVGLNPARIATILLLENPQLLSANMTLPEKSEDPETQRLIHLVSYLKQRPNSKFSNILGYWGGAYGADAQQELALLLANQIFTNKHLLGNYNSEQELYDTFKRINAFNTQENTEKELKALEALNYNELTAEQKERLKTLVTLKYSSKQTQ